MKSNQQQNQQQHSSLRNQLQRQRGSLTLLATPTATLVATELYHRCDQQEGPVFPWKTTTTTTTTSALLTSTATTTSTTVTPKPPKRSKPLRSLRHGIRKRLARRRQGLSSSSSSHRNHHHKKDKNGPGLNNTSPSSSPSASLVSSSSNSSNSDDDEFNETFAETNLILDSLLEEFPYQLKEEEEDDDYTEDDGDDEASRNSHMETSTTSTATIVASNCTIATTTSTTTSPEPSTPAPMAFLSKKDRSLFSSNLIRMLQQRDQQQEESTIMLFSSQEKADIESDINSDFSETLVLEQLQNGKSMLEAHLAASNHLITEFLTIDHVLQQQQQQRKRAVNKNKDIDRNQIMISSSTTQDILFDLLESFLYPRLAFLYHDAISNNNKTNHHDNSSNHGSTINSNKYNSITPKEATELLSWIDRFLTLVKTQMPHQLEVVLSDNQPCWKQDMQHLAQFYLDTAVRSAMRQMLTRAWELHQKNPDDNIREAATTGHAVSDFPEQVSYMYQVQLDTAKSRLPASIMTNPGDLEQQVVSICNQELVRLVGDMQLKIGSEWKDISASFFCALINDAHRLAEQCEKHNAKYLMDADDGDDDKHALVEEGHSLVRDLTELALYATDYLCQRIMLSLCKPKNDILTSIGDETWEVDESCVAMERTIATLKDYFADLQVWLATEYFFLKVLKTCFALTIQIYLESFFGNTLLHGVKNPGAVAEELRRDYLRLVIFFNGSSFEKYYQDDDSDNSVHRNRLFYSQASVNESLRILQNMAAIISPSDPPESLQDDIMAVLQRFKADHGSAAVLHLAGLRKRHDSVESMVWVKAIASARKAMAQEQQQQQEREEQQKQQGDSDSEERNEQESPRGGGKKDKKPVVGTTAVHVPDLRNSRYISNIRPFQRPEQLRRRFGRPKDLSLLDREISAGTLPHAQSTLQLLEASPMPVFFQKAKVFTNSLLTTPIMTIPTTTAIITRTSTAITTIATGGANAKTTKGHRNSDDATTTENGEEQASRTKDGEEALLIAAAPVPRPLIARP
ncbi:hypothetical protein ACA910_010124 [Epithemia clementina (nom. ined.)]